MQGKWSGRGRRRGRSTGWHKGRNAEKSHAPPPAPSGRAEGIQRFHAARKGHTRGEAASVRGMYGVRDQWRCTQGSRPCVRAWCVPQGEPGQVAPVHRQGRAQALPHGVHNGTPAQPDRRGLGNAHGLLAVGEVGRAGALHEQVFSGSPWRTGTGSRRQHLFRLPEQRPCDGGGH